MNKFYNRRSWFKQAFTASAGLAVTPALMAKYMEGPVSEAERHFYHSVNQNNKKIRLNSNENPYGPSEKARQAIIESIQNGNRYAFAELSELRKLIAEQEGVSPDFIMLGAGSGELLVQTGVAYGLKGGRVLSGYPTFPLLLNYAEDIGATWDKIDLNDRLEFDYEKMLSAIKSDTQMVFVCNPNNPTGTYVNGNFVKEFCTEAAKKTIVYSDEAYIEFVPPSQQVSMIGLVESTPNLIVSKTFSKVYGLAGLRIGYIVAHPDVLKYIGKFGDSISPSQTALAAAKASLGDEGFMQMTREKNGKALNILMEYVKGKGWQIGESVTNVVFFPAPIKGETILKRLDEKGYLIRIWDYQNKEWCRVSIGTIDEMKGFVKAFEEVISA